MECFFVSEEDIHSEEGYFLLRDNEAHHAVRSLRLREGAELMATTFNGLCIHGRVETIEENKKSIIVSSSIICEFPFHNEAGKDVLLAVGVLSQQSRFEDVLEKTTEYGIKGIIPFTSSRTEKKQVNTERSLKILERATKQVSRACMPKLYDAMSLAEALQMAKNQNRTIFLFHEQTETEKNFSGLASEIKSPVALFIGPEGGFSSDEVELAEKNFGAHVVSLGERRLRAESAAVAGCAVILCGN
jgi:16S rRNA (uracil1498-N3)-methyltransferase